MSITQTITRAMSRVAGLARFGTGPPTERVYVPTANLDAFRTYVSDALTFAKLKAFIRAADSGDIATTLGLFEEMEEKDLHLQGVANTRRCALTGLEWEVISAAETQRGRVDKALADDAAGYVEEKLGTLESLDEALEHLATAIGPNLAVVELVWDGWELETLVPIPSHRLTMQPRDVTKVRVVTEENRLGVVATPGKFIVHSPHGRAGFPFRCTIAQAQAFVYLIKFLAMSDWAGYVEMFGQPMRWAKYRPGASTDEKNEALDMLKNMGSAAYGLFSEAIECELTESSQRGTSPHKDLIDWCERKQSIGWLGQHMTTDTSGATGTYATAAVQDQVRRDLLVDDVRREGRTIRRDLIAPLCAFQFSGRDVPLPTLRRRFREEVDRKIEAEIIARAQQAGAAVPKDWAHERLGIPKPEGDEAVLEPSLGAFGEQLTEGGGANAGW